MVLPILVLLLLAGSPALAEGGDWLAALGRQVASLDRAARPPEAPDFGRVDLFGKPFRLSGLAGRTVVLSFLDRDSVPEAVRWLDRQTTWFLHQEGITFVNVFFPGGIFFLVPRGEAVARIRREVDETRAGMAEGLDPASRQRLETADIRWVVDWKREWSSLYPVERGRVNLFLLDRERRIREVWRYQDDEPPERLQEAVVRLLAEVP